VASVFDDAGDIRWVKTAAEILRGVSLKNRGTIREKTRLRSRIANGTQFLPTTDGRSIWARLMRETFECLLIHCGGAEVVSETQRLIARRVSTLEAELVFIEDKLASIRAAGGEPDPVTVDLYGRLADRQRRLADPLGWQRPQPRDVTGLSQLLQEDWRQQQQEAAHAESLTTDREAAGVMTSSGGEVA
jgi:hypothetical protein